MLDRILASPREDGTGVSDLDAGMRRIAAVAPRRGLVVVISDFLSEPDSWRNALGSLALRHSVLCVETIDPRDVDLPAVGMLQFVDPATGRVRRPSPPAGERRW